jgi:hypothetical protein
MPTTIGPVHPGEVYAIPLFLTDVPTLTRFGRRDAFSGRGAEFTYCRAIDDERGSGLLVEVYDLVGPLDADLTTVIAAPRLFRPVATTRLAMHKRRWRFVGRCDPYDRESDSDYSQIQLVLGPYEKPVLWQGGETIGPIGVEEAPSYERWQIWFADQLERRIIKELGDRAPVSAPWTGAPTR